MGGCHRCCLPFVSWIRNRSLKAKQTINRVTCIGGVKGSSKVVVQAQSVDSLAHTVQVVVLGQLSDELNELVLINQDTASSIVEHVTGRLADDSERKARVVAPAELKINVFSFRLWHALLRQINKIGRQDIVGDVGAIQMSRLDVDVQTVCVLDVDSQVQGLNVGSVDVALHLLSICVLSHNRFGYLQVRLPDSTSR